jgi:uncharacterized protein (TIGR02598 family)
MINTNTKTRTNRKSGFPLVETLVAGAILATSVVGLVSFGYVNFQMTSHSTNMTAASAAARSEIEQVRLEGFTNASEGSSTDYYDTNGSYPASASQTSASVYSAQTTVTSDLLNGSVPAPGALRQVKVIVSLVSTGQEVYRTYTYLASGGI